MSCSTSSLFEAHRNTSAIAEGVIFMAAKLILRPRFGFLQLQICGLHAVQLGNLNLFIMAFVGFCTIQSTNLYILIFDSNFLCDYFDNQDDLPARISKILANVSIAALARSSLQCQLNNDCSGRCFSSQ
jgi:hypothetical protein